MTMHIDVAYKSTRRDYVLVLNRCISQLPMLHVSIVNEGWNYVTPLVAPPNDLWDRLVLGCKCSLVRLMITQLLRIFVYVFQIKNTVQQGYEYLLIV